MVIYQSEENFKGTFVNVVLEDGDFKFKVYTTINGKSCQLLAVVPILDPEDLGRSVLSAEIGYDDWVVYQP